MSMTVAISRQVAARARAKGCPVGDVVEQVGLRRLGPWSGATVRRPRTPARLRPLASFPGTPRPCRTTWCVTDDRPRDVSSDRHGAWVVRDSPVRSGAPISGVSPPDHGPSMAMVHIGTRYRFIDTWRARTGRLNRAARPGPRNGLAGVDRFGPGESPEWVPSAASAP